MAGIFLCIVPLQPVFIRSRRRSMQCYRCETGFVLNLLGPTYPSCHSLLIVDAKRMQFNCSEEKRNNSESRIEALFLKIALLVIYPLLVCGRFLGIILNSSFLLSTALFPSLLHHTFEQHLCVSNVLSIGFQQQTLCSLSSGRVINSHSSQP